jgi:SOS-response transcriptional repressor LexA
MALGERLKIARLEANISQTELAKDIGVSQAAVAALEKRNSKTCGYTAQIAKTLNVRVEWLATGKGEMRGEDPELNVVNFPVIAWASVFRDRIVESHVPFYGNVGMNVDEGFGVQVTGISMEPEFSDGDTVIINTTQKPKHNDFVIANVNEQPTLKQLVIEEGRYFLRALNPNWTPMLAPIERDTPIAGVVVAKTRQY